MLHVRYFARRSHDRPCFFKFHLLRNHLLIHALHNHLGLNDLCGYLDLQWSPIQTLVALDN